MTKQDEMFRRFDEKFKDQITGGDWHDYEYVAPQVKQFLQSEIDLALAERDKEIVEIIKDFKFYDWSGEEEIYNQVEEIIERIITKEKTCPSK